MMHAFSFLLVEVLMAAFAGHRHGMPVLPSPLTCLEEGERAAHIVHFKVRRISSSRLDRSFRFRLSTPNQLNLHMPPRRPNCPRSSVCSLVGPSLFRHVPTTATRDGAGLVRQAPPPPPRPAEPSRIFLARRQQASSREARRLRLDGHQERETHRQEPYHAAQPPPPPPPSTSALRQRFHNIPV